MQLTVTVDLSSEKTDVFAAIDNLRKVVEAWFTDETSPPQPNVVPVSAASDTLAHPIASLGAGARTVYNALLKKIEESAEATLVDVAAETGMSIPTIRAHLMNAGRTFRASGICDPLVATWDPVRSCVIYTKR